MSVREARLVEFAGGTEEQVKEPREYNISANACGQVI